MKYLFDQVHEIESPLYKDGNYQDEGRYVLEIRALGNPPIHHYYESLVIDAFNEQGCCRRWVIQEVIRTHSSEEDGQLNCQFSFDCLREYTLDYD